MSQEAGAPPYGDATKARRSVEQGPRSDGDATVEARRGTRIRIGAQRSAPGSHLRPEGAGTAPPCAGHARSRRNETGAICDDLAEAAAQ